VGHFSAGGFNPYFGITYVADYKRDAQTTVFGAPSPANDRDGFVYVLGANLFSKGALSGGVRFQQEDRRQQKLNLLMANIAIRF
jgi:hypothetical protein